MWTSFLQAPMAALVPSTSVHSLRSKSTRSLKTFCSAKIPNPMPAHINPNDPFLSKLAAAAAASPEAFVNRPSNSGTLPYLDIYDSPTLMASPAQVRSLLHWLIFSVLYFLLWTSC